MIVFNPNARIKKINGSYTKGADLVVNLYFDSGNILNSPKSIFDMIFMLAGQYSTDHITTVNVGHTDIDSKEVLNMLSNWGIVRQISTGLCDALSQARDKLGGYTAHFPIMSNINIMIAVLLQKMHIKSIFYDCTTTIAEKDVNRNIYYKVGDVGKNIASFIKNEMRIDTIHFADSNFNVSNLNKNVDIIINSDVTNWFNIEGYIVINTWNYKNVQFDHIKLFNKETDISEDLKELVDEYILATRSIVDMQYSVIGIVE